MSAASAFIFVKVTLSSHGNMLLSAAFVGEPALCRHAAVRTALTRIKGDMMLMLMDHLSQESLKPLQMDFHTSVQ